MTEPELDALVDKLFENDEFVKRVAIAAKNSLGEPKSKISGQIKQELEKHFVEYKKRKTEEITKDLDDWFYNHLKGQIERSKENVSGMFQDHIDDWLKDYSESAFHQAANELIKEMVKARLAKKDITINLGDLIGYY